MRNKNKSPSPTPPFFPGSTSLLISLPPPPERCRGTGTGVLWSVHHMLSLPLLPPQGEDSSRSSPDPAWGPSHGRQSSMNFSNVTPPHGLQFFTNCSSVGPFHGVQSFRNGLLQRGLLSLHGVPGPARSLLQCRLSTGSQPPSGVSTSSGVGSSTGCRRISAPPWTSMDCRGTACLTMVFTTGCRGISALVPGAPPPPPSSLTWVSAGLFLSHILTPLFRLLLRSRFFPLLKYVIPEALPPSLIGSALASGGSFLELAGTGSIGHVGSFWRLLTEATQLPKPCHANPIQYVSAFNSVKNYFS
ncbi:uncharacterized protein LOC126035357 [Accipiter gentilis]|uniref:uncharacterized protein LOC126035357 n=1 Tax=Astur gentilis TaxID=8957 RepID=UPI002110285F|nr:uncharacterized protein LOC126035357 [Accipiter gentilis]XP_049649851.1 uncharacterized protein LOC126035357 [Accipiter gentilis]